MANETQRTSTSQGRCLCGAVRFTLRGQLRDVSFCHCHMCQQAGTLGGAYTACSHEQITFDAGAEQVKWYRSSDIARRGFCGECGSQLFWEPASRTHLSVSAGSLDQPTGLVPGKHIFCDGLADYALARGGINLDRA